MADESNDNSEKESVNYVRKKNLIPGIDNDHLILGGLGVLTAIGLAPYVKQLAENFMRNLPQNQGQQYPPNGMQQQPVYLPPPVPQQQQNNNLPPGENHTHEHFHEHEHSPLAEHEQGMKDQQAYEAAKEKEEVTSPVSFNMIPDRSTQVSNKNKSKGNYEAGSNISGSYS